jgi:hypothetical protein
MKTHICIVCTVLASPAFADQQVGELTAQSPRWDRLSNNSVMNDGVCNSVTADDSVNDQVPYQRFLIRTTALNTPIDVRVVSLEPEPIDFDPFVAVYCAEFDPETPFSALLTLDDDSAGYPNASVLASGPLLLGIQYSVVVSSYSNWAPSQFGQFAIELGDGLEFVNPCPADLNGDDELNFFDVSAFLTAFNAMDPIADFNNDSVFNFFDVSAFLSAFNDGCP